MQEGQSRRTSCLIYFNPTVSEGKVSSRWMSASPAVTSSVLPLNVERKLVIVAARGFRIKEPVVK